MYAKSIYDKDDGQEKKSSHMQLEICMYLLWSVSYMREYIISFKSGECSLLIKNTESYQVFFKDISFSPASPAAVDRLTVPPSVDNM